LFFVPLLFVGLHLGRDMARTSRLMLFALVAGVPTMVIGFVEAIALALGKGAVLYGLYGPSAAAAFTTGDNPVQGAAVSLGALHRVPSLFSFPAAYYSFCLAMLVPSYVLWRCGESAR